jgi:superfamily II DNA or RNA helicase
MVFLCAVTNNRMARVTPRLTFDRGTLLLHPPPSSGAWAGIAEWDDRIERLRAPAWQYRRLLEGLAKDNVPLEDKAKAFEVLALPKLEQQPFAHQTKALEAWTQAGRQGVVILPTGSGKSFLAMLAMQRTQRSTLICVPTLDLMHQWYANLEAAFKDALLGAHGTGLLGLHGGGSKDLSSILISTYDSAHRLIEHNGNRWGLLIFDEVHHLAGELYKTIAEYSLAPYRLGLTATLERSDGKHQSILQLVGQVVFRASPEDLAGGALAPYDLVRLNVDLSQAEREEYDAHFETRNAFLKKRNIRLGSLEGWSRFVRESAKSQEGRRAMLAHRELKRLSKASDAKIRLLDEVLQNHLEERTLIFTDDNETVYDISKRLLIPAITHQTPVKERHSILEQFKNGAYPVLVASRVLNEGVDVPEASLAVVLSGTGSNREHVQRLGRILRPRPNKRAKLIEVVSKDTLEEATAKRRHTKLEPIEAKKPREGLEKIEATLGFEDLIGL